MKSWFFLKALTAAGFLPIFHNVVIELPDGFLGDSLKDKSEDEVKKNGAYSDSKDHKCRRHRGLRKGISTGRKKKISLDKKNECGGFPWNAFTICDVPSVEKLGLPSGSTTDLSSLYP